MHDSMKGQADLSKAPSRDEPEDSTLCPRFLELGWADNIRGFVSSWEIVP